MELQRAGLLRFSLIVGASVAGDARHSRASANLIGTALQLEAERDVFHHTTFVLRDLYITRSYGVTIMTEGIYRLDAVESMPTGTGKAPFRLVIRDELATANV